MTNRTAPADLPALPQRFDVWREDDDSAGAWGRRDRDVFTADQMREYGQQCIAAFLARSGQWLTNEATHKAFEAETRRKALDEALSRVLLSDTQAGAAHRIRALIDKA